MNKTVLMIMGKSGSGKSTLEHDLVENYPDEFHKVVSVTTRSPREGEVDGRDYHFVDDEEFNRLEQSGKLIQKTEFANNQYGSMKSEYTTDHRYSILVAVPISAKNFSYVLPIHFPDTQIMNILFNISEEQLWRNMRSRGDDEETIRDRLSKDTLDQDVKDAGIVPDIVINDALLDFNLHHRVKSFLDAREQNQHYEDKDG